MADHPRSRGVYCDRSSRSLFDRGSSPLARGLPVVDARQDSLARIIPARAGFTCSRRSPGQSRQDHPRSRGVYSMSSWAGSAVRGSSPLARGLHDARRLHLHLRGIIPARAGFTSTRPGLTVWSGGSSPLARGLPRLPPALPGGHGIIPARAGFTMARRPPTARTHGSSPLARGLPRRGRV